jgi:hypothetical protein
MRRPGKPTRRPGKPPEGPPTRNRKCELAGEVAEVQRNQYEHELLESSFVRVPKPNADQRARDAAAATAEYKAEELATREKTARLRKLRLERQAADNAKGIRE